MRTFASILSLVGLLGIAACTGEFVPVDPTSSGGGVDGGNNQTGPFTFTADVSPLFETHCNVCHNEAAKAGFGNYATDTYAGTLEPGTDVTANVIAGDMSSLIITYIGMDHQSKTSLEPALDTVVTGWIVDNLAAEN